MEKPPSRPNKNGRRVAAVSLSPRKTRKALNPSLVPAVRPRAKNNLRNFGIAMSKNETVLVTGSGDVLVARCRYSSKAYKQARQQENDNAKRSSDDSESAFWSECQNVCNPCGSSRSTANTGGLLGGAPPDFDAQAQSETSETNTEVHMNGSLDTSPDKKDNGDVPPVSTSDASGNDAQTFDVVRTSASAPVDSSHGEEKSDEDDHNDLAVLPSFDYTYFEGEGNDMVPIPSQEMESIVEEVKELKIEEKRKEEPPEIKVAPPNLMHGVPTFLPSFHQMKITLVSANPLGSHVLLISSEALLFSFGLNNHGQLGHGYQTSTKGPSMGFVTKPSIVTPLLENGGKAVTCSAGVDYSLVVVKTEGKRIGRLNPQQSRDCSASHRRGSSESDLLTHSMTRVSSLPTRIQSENDALEASSDDSVESMCHHQLYGFGRNDGRKLGLVEPSKRKKGEDVLVPRRVALSCNVWRGTEDDDSDLPPPGIFAVAASAHHSAALVRRASGAIELYTWGEASSYALGPLAEGSSPSKDKGKGRNPRVNGGFTLSPIAVTVPTIVRELSHSALDDCTNGNDVTPVKVALGPTSTFVITSKGKVLSFGKSDDGLLGQGHGVVMTDKPSQILFPSLGSRTETNISSLSVGPSHAVAVASSGKVFAWGKNQDGKMGFDGALTKHMSRGVRRGTGGKERASSPQSEVEWIPIEVLFPTSEQAVSTRKWIRKKSADKETLLNPIGPPPLSGDNRMDKVIQACAGLDMTVFVKDSGEVFSCGSSSGRLGLGETGSESVTTPTPMYGGLRLWR